MQFKDVLKRYHISPLQYEDNTELNERDYYSLFVFLQKYYTIKALTDNKFKMPVVDDVSVQKVIKNKEKSLLPLSEEECLDMLMNQKTKEVVL